MQRGWKMKNDGRYKATLAALLIAVMMLAGSAFGRERLSRDFGKIKSNDTVTVILQYSKAPQAEHSNRVKQHGGVWKNQFKHFNGAVVTMRRDRLEKLLANDPDLTYVTPERPMKGSLAVSAATIDTYAAWNTGYDGRGIGV